VSLYDTRFFFEHYYASDPVTLRRTKKELEGRGRRFVSSVTVHELYRLVLEREGRDVAKLRAGLVVKEFTVIPLDAELAVSSAEIRSKHRIPMADSIIIATARMYRLECVTDDPHLAKVREVKTRWLR
jgi:predicted nucleic acid-binding protein